MNEDPHFKLIYEFFDTQTKISATVLMRKFKITFEGANKYLLECYRHRHMIANQLRIALDEKE